MVTVFDLKKVVYFREFSVRLLNLILCFVSLLCYKKNNALLKSIFSSLGRSKLYYFNLLDNDLLLIPLSFFIFYNSCLYYKDFIAPGIFY